MPSPSTNMRSYCSHAVLPQVADDSKRGDLFLRVWVFLGRLMSNDISQRLSPLKCEIAEESHSHSHRDTHIQEKLVRKSVSFRPCFWGGLLSMASSTHCGALCCRGPACFSSRNPRPCSVHCTAVKTCFPTPLCLLITSPSLPHRAPPLSLPSRHCSTAHLPHAARYSP